MDLKFLDKIIDEAMVEQGKFHADLTRKEESFLEDMADRRLHSGDHLRVTEAQERWLRDIARKIGVEE